MPESQSEILQIFRQSGALLQGHFILRSGLHSGHYFQCALVCQYPWHVERLAGWLLEKVRHLSFDTVLAPAMGGLVIGQELARQAGVRYIFAEKINDRLALRRGFKIEPEERVLVVEDVITRGGRAVEAIEIIRREGAVPAGLAVLVDRSEGKAVFDIPWQSLVQLSFPTYTEGALPGELAAIPVQKPGS